LSSRGNIYLRSSDRRSYCWSKVTSDGPGIQSLPEKFCWSALRSVVQHSSEDQTGDNASTLEAWNGERLPVSTTLAWATGGVGLCDLPALIASSCCWLMDEGEVSKCPWSLSVVGTIDRTDVSRKPGALGVVVELWRPAAVEQLTGAPFTSTNVLEGALVEMGMPFCVLGRWGFGGTNDLPEEVPAKVLTVWDDK
jgi:hypothetical protein